jgi:hypothetical protein
MRVSQATTGRCDAASVGIISGSLKNPGIWTDALWAGAAR